MGSKLQTNVTIKDKKHFQVLYTLLLLSVRCPVSAYRETCPADTVFISIADSAVVVQVGLAVRLKVLLTFLAVIFS